MQQLYKLMVEKDATMLEINPMVEVMKEGKRKGGRFCTYTSGCCGILYVDLWDIVEKM